MSFRDGDRSMFFKCADGDSTKTCADAIGPIIEQLMHSDVSGDETETPGATGGAGGTGGTGGAGGSSGTSGGAGR